MYVNIEPNKYTLPPNTAHRPSTHTQYMSHRREQGQLFGKVNHAGDGWGDDLGELTESLQVHLVPVGRGGHRGLTDVLRLDGERTPGVNRAAHRARSTDCFYYKRFIHFIYGQRACG